MFCNKKIICLICSSVRSLWKALAFLMLVSIGYNEFLINLLQSLKWSNINCQSSNCTRILFVADSQILGDTNDYSWISAVANFDSDWHLKKTFSHAFAHARPDVICFLGDIFDEGSSADDTQYQRYYERFREIFQMTVDDREDSPQVIIVPGDSDIGQFGGNSPKVNRFRKMFYEKEMWLGKGNIIFYNINRITHEMPSYDSDNKHDNYTRIFLSHLPILESDEKFSKKVNIKDNKLTKSFRKRNRIKSKQFAAKALETFKPHLIFSGHHHQSLIMKTKLKRLHSPEIPNSLNNDKKTAYAMNKFNIDDIFENNEVLEIYIPTCSYRMGEMDIGFGYAVLDNRNLFYTVLWTTQRFYQLSFYLFLLFIVVFYILVIKIPDMIVYIGNRLIGRESYKNDRPYRYLPL
uniref:CSON000539 protein n=1 Tax=Culicoides sonorensis TaxID=179676 RepID=A0A336MKE9_CULSO